VAAVKNPWLRGCGPWHRTSVGVARTCGGVMADVELLRSKSRLMPSARYRWAMYVPGHPGTWATGYTGSYQEAKKEADAALVRYGKR
jgi:hypothetical protein